ncbi:cytochrome ubiquinol oxidase subunit I [bacterium]|nr:cytochrome ubiquinol oxidase subunit I [bacterium]
MSNLFAARSLMGLSLGFHIIFAVVGMVMPFLMVVSHGLWIRTGKPAYLTLTRLWSKGVAVLFATGAVSGTVLSFELGLLWPQFMEVAGPIIGMPFSLEGTAFFIEAIAIGLFLYGWDRIPPTIHWVCGLMVGISGILSGIFVVAANAWMNAPAGFKIKNGVISSIDPIAAMMNPAWLSQSIHMVLAAFVATGFVVAGIHAVFLIRNSTNPIHLPAFRIAIGIASVAAILQLFSGDFSAKDIAERQPVKFAAMEAHYHTERGAALTLGGIPDSNDESVKFAIKIPKLLSILKDNNPDSEVKGLEEFPKSDWPSVPVVHIAFQVMVACGTVLAGIAAWCLWVLIKKRPFSRTQMMVVAAASPLGFIALEAGWVVTEVGRQPWIIYGVMRTTEAVTPMPGVWVSLVGFALLYFILSIMVISLLIRQFRDAQ